MRLAPTVSRKGVIQLGLFFLVLLALSCLADGFDLYRVVEYQLSRGDSPTPVRNAVVYTTAYVISVLGVAIVLAHRNPLLRVGGYGVVAITAAVFMGFRGANGTGFGYHEASLVFGEPDFIPDALSHFFGTYAPNVALSLLVVVAIAVYARLFVPRLRSWAWLAIPVAAVFMDGRILEATYSKVFEFPIPYRVPLIAAYAQERLVPYYGAREPVQLAPKDPAVADHVIFVMDESVTGDLLGVNGGAPETTPRLARRGDRILNYGVASSISNLSSTTNLALQAGLRPDQVPDTELASLKNPNVFAYMDAAGFATFLIDGQVYSGRPNNMMTRFDLEALDGHLPLRALSPDQPIHEVDFLAIDEIMRILDENETSFVYLIKAGAHFPYGDKAPEAERHFRPDLDDDSDAPALDRTLNSYRNALRWTVDAFLDELIERIDASGESAVVVYTSDHGQSLYASVGDTARTGRPTRWPHGVPHDPPARQASIPLLMIGFSEPVDQRLRSLYAPELRDRASQWSLFASLLELAGYDRQDLSGHSPSLFAPAAEAPARVFVSGNLFGMGSGIYNHELIRESVQLNDFVLPARPDERAD